MSHKILIPQISDDSLFLESFLQQNPPDVKVQICIHCPNVNAQCLLRERIMLKISCYVNTVTFSGEKLLGIFPQHSVFSRDFPQQFNDQCYVICIGKHCQQNRNTRQFNQYTACRHCYRPRRQKQSAACTNRAQALLKAPRRG